MAFLTQQIFVGLAQGCIYGLIALGFTIIFKSSGAINFAQGQLLLLGAFIASLGVYQWHLNFFLAILIAMGMTIIVAVFFEYAAVRHLIGKPVFALIMITIGLSTILREAVTMTQPTSLLSPAEPYKLTSGITYQGVHFGLNGIWTIIVTLLCCAALFLFLRYTRYGLAMRATAIDQEAALAMGVNIQIVNHLAWIIAAVLGTIAGIFLAINRSTFDATLGDLALTAFPAIILGGLGSIPGAVIGGVAIGLVEELTAGYESHFPTFLGNGFHSVAPYLLMIIILIVRPYGLFGTPDVERV
jgi:branched-chain amino acid transport system permease protein